MRGGSLRFKKVSVSELLHPPALGDLREITAAVAEDGRPAVVGGCGGSETGD